MTDKFNSGIPKCSNEATSTCKTERYFVAEFHGSTRLFHFFRTEPVKEVRYNQKSPEATNWPVASNTWFAHRYIVVHTRGHAEPCLTDIVYSKHVNIIPT